MSNIFLFEHWLFFKTIFVPLCVKYWSSHWKYSSLTNWLVLVFDQLKCTLNMFVCTRCMCFHHLGSIDGTVRCWDTRSKRYEPIQVLDEARDSISSLKVAQHELLTGSVDHSHLGADHKTIDWKDLISRFVCGIISARWMAEWGATTWEWDSCMLTSSTVSNVFMVSFQFSERQKN